MAEHRRGLQPDTPAAVEQILRLVGLGIRSRGTVVGVERVRDAARSGQLKLGIVAVDASANSLDKVIPLLVARRISFIDVPSARQLGALAGREQTAVAGIVDAQLAKGIRALVRSGSPRSIEEGV